MIERCAKFAGALLIGSQALWAFACSSAEDPIVTASGGNTQTGAGGATAASGSTGTSGSVGAGGSAPAGECVATWPNPINTACGSVKNLGACTTAGQVCGDLVCGIGDSGRRSCTCTAALTWDCPAGQCDFSQSQFKDKTTLTKSQCAGTEIDKAACGTSGGSPIPLCGMCEGLPSGEICVCVWDSSKSKQYLDCDKPPVGLGLSGW